MFPARATGLTLAVAVVLNAQTPPFTTLANFGLTGGTNLSSLVQGVDGNFYGTAYSGGARGGSVFKLTPAGTLTDLYNFCAKSPCLDGTSPAGLVRGSDGNFYGTTNQFGANQYGTFFRITQAGVLTDGNFTRRTATLGPECRFKVT